MMEEIRLRRYTPKDCRYLAELFYDTVHTVNAKDYTQEQLCAWAPGNVDMGQWNQSFLAHTTFIAEKNGCIAGFGDIDETGYLDRLYVHKDFQGEGIATALCNALEESITGTDYSTHASVTAKPFFEKRGYRVLKAQEVWRQGVCLQNFIMVKERG